MQQMSVKINKIERSYIPPDSSLGTATEAAPQERSYNGDFDVGCPQQILPQIITSLGKPIIEERPLGLLKAKPSKSGKRRGRFYGSMVNVSVLPTRLLLVLMNYSPELSGFGKECALVCSAFF